MIGAYIHQLRPSRHLQRKRVEATGERRLQVDGGSFQKGWKLYHS
jgi:hypothetical protein